MKEAKKEPKKKEQQDTAVQEDLLAQLQRLQAEFENYKKRTEREQEERKHWLCSGYVEGLLPIIDNFELALKNVADKNPFYQGIEMIYAQLKEYLEKMNVKEIDTTGAIDPAKHEALMVEKQDGVEKGAIIETLQKGYEINGRIIRTAKVKVAK